MLEALYMHKIGVTSLNAAGTIDVACYLVYNMVFVPFPRVKVFVIDGAGLLCQLFAWEMNR